LFFFSRSVTEVVGVFVRFRAPLQQNTRPVAVRWSPDLSRRTILEAAVRPATIGTPREFLPAHAEMI
jgi:hypothetical protein